jgi:hypothetical protein
LPGLFTDRKELFQILLNLANNAVKFAEHGAVRIRCQTIEITLKITGTDTGIGIRRENMPLLFEAFRHVEGSDQRRYEGTDLGLYLSRKLAGLIGRRYQSGQHIWPWLRIRTDDPDSRWEAHDSRRAWVADQERPRLSVASIYQAGYSL